jgi:hypothetical protein
MGVDQGVRGAAMLTTLTALAIFRNLDQSRERRDSGAPDHPAR